MDFNKFLEMYKEWQSKPHMYIVNPRKMKYFQTAHNSIIHVMNACNPDAKIEIAVNEFNDGSASITVETDELIVKNMGMFINVIDNASNFEIYPLLDGNIRFSVTFNGIMELIK